METKKNHILAFLLDAFNGSENGSFHHVVSLLPHLVFTFDARNKILHFHNEKRLTSLLGYEKEDIPYWQENMLNIIYDEDAVSGAHEINKVFQLTDNGNHCFTCRFNHKTDTCRYVVVCAAGLSFDQDGRAQSFLFTAEDDTEKAELEKKVQVLQSQVDDTESLLEYGSWNWEIESGILNWSDGMYKLLGYRPEETKPFVSLGFYEQHILPKDRAAFLSVLQTAAKNESDFEVTYMIHTRQNQQRVVLTKGRMLKFEDGTVRVMSGVTCDITGLTKMNSDLITYKEMIMEREDFLNQGSWETNLKTGETSWSKGMFRIFGYESEEEMAATKVTSTLHMSHMEPEELENHKHNWAQVLNEQSSYLREAPILTQQGRHKHVETYGKIIRDKDGTPLKVIGSTKDVTSLREYKNSLEEKITELNHRNTELEGFAYIASHDLQEPLRKLTAFSERLLSKFRNLLGDEGQLYLDRIAASTENMRTLIDNLLEFSRTARSSKHFSRRNLMQLFREAQSDLELKIEESKAVINVDPLPELEVIPSQIVRLFGNLLSNSFKFKRADRSLVITVTCGKLSNQEKKTHNLKNTQDYYRLAFADNGIGFEGEYAERIFQMFQRLHGKHEYPGSGIGLAICKKIVENHNGIIYAEGEVNAGSVFTVILPENQ